MHEVELRRLLVATSISISRLMVRLPLDRICALLRQTNAFCLLLVLFVSEGKALGEASS